MSEHEKTLGGRYVLQELIGEGGAARVYRAHDSQLNRTVAVKLLRAAFGLSEIPRERFRREAQSMAALSHPNLLTIHDVGEYDNDMFLVMELVDGQPLSRLLSDKSLPRPALMEMLEKIARAVGEVHRHGIVHRDIKPANILVTSDGQPRVGDFGLAHLVDSDTALTRTGAALGTPMYMAPEQVRGAEVTARTDVHALGVLLYEMLTGEPAYRGNTVANILAQIAQAEPPSPRKMDSSVSPDLEAVAWKAMEKDPRKRYADAEEFADDIRRHLDGDSVSVRPPTIVQRVVRRLARKRIWIGVAGGLLISAILFVVLVLPALSDASSLERARAHLDAGRSYVSRLDRLLTRADAKRHTIEDLMKEARREFDQALKIHPRHPEAFLELARLAALDYRQTEAEEFMNRAIAEDPEFSTAYLERGVLRLVRYVDAMSMDDLSLRKEPPGLRKLRLLIQEDLEKVRKWSDRPQELTFVRGIMSFADQDYETAATVLREYSETAVSDARGWYYLGWALFRQRERFNDAVEAVNRALDFRPRDPLIRILAGLTHHARAEAEARMGRFTKADKTLDDALRHLDYVVENYWPTNVTGRMNRAMVTRARGDMYKDTGRMEEARTVYRSALADYDACLGLESVIRANTLNNRANLYMAMGKPALALKDYDDSVRLQPDEPMVYANRGYARSLLGDHEGALEDGTRAVDLDPDTAFNWKRRGDYREASGDVRGAIQDYDRALEIDPRHEAALINRGGAHRRLGHWTESLADFDAVLKVSPGSATGHNGKAVALYNLKRAKESLASYDEAIRINPNYAFALNNRGLAHDSLGNTELAIADYERAIRVDPAYATPHMNLGMIHRRRNDWDQALPCFEEAVRLKPDYVKARYWRAQGYMEKKRFGEAMRDWDLLIQARPDDPELFSSRALCQIGLEKYSKAVLDYSEVIRLRPENPSGYEMRGRVHAVLKDWDRSVGDFERSVRLTPKNSKAYDVRLDLLKRARANLKP